MKRRSAFATAAVATVLLIVLAIQLSVRHPGADPGAPPGAAASTATEAPDGQPPDTTGWVDADNKPVARGIIEEVQGPEHCGWQSTTWLFFRDVLYIRDPRGVLRASTIVGFDPDVSLPGDARSTGFHEDGRTIWVANDPSMIYVVTATRVEQWPRALDPSMGCA